MNLTQATVLSNEIVSSESHYSIGRLIIESRLIWLSHTKEITDGAVPGQFVMVDCGESCILPRPFSIHRVQNGNIALLFSVWAEGKGTTWLANRKPGDNVKLFGALGNGFSIEKGSRNLLMIAGGIGVAPLTFLAEQAHEQGCEVNLLLGTKKADLAKHLSEKLVLPSRVKLNIISEETLSGKCGRVTDLITPNSISWANQIYLSGPVRMYQNLATNNIFRNNRVQATLEVRMGCGVGVCCGCTVRTRNGLRQVCKDGPVFELNDIVWDAFSFGH